MNDLRYAEIHLGINVNKVFAACEYVYYWLSACHLYSSSAGAVVFNATVGRFAIQASSDAATMRLERPIFRDSIEPSAIRR